MLFAAFVAPGAPATPVAIMSTEIASERRSTLRPRATLGSQGLRAAMAKSSRTIAEFAEEILFGRYFILALSGFRRSELTRSKGEARGS